LKTFEPIKTKVRVIAGYTNSFKNCKGKKSSSWRKKNEINFCFERPEISLLPK
jgi:hypothetical protein